MIDAVIVLCILLLLVLVSFHLDRYSCTIVSHSSFSILFGLFFGFGVCLYEWYVVSKTTLPMGWKGNDTQDQQITDSVDDSSNTTEAQSIEYLFNFHNSIFFSILLPPIIYEAGFSIHRRIFFKNLGAIVGTAFLGTIVSTICTGLALFWLSRSSTELTWIEAFMFAALLSAIDPVATLGCFNKLNVSNVLFNMVFGESVLNDAVAIILYQTLKRWDADKDLTAGEIVTVIFEMILMFLGSMAISIFITLAGAFLLKRSFMGRLRQFPVYEISLCLIFSLMTYFVADMTGFSGIVALFFSGSMTAHYHFYTISAEAQHTFLHLLHTLAFVSETFVYVFMGTSFTLIFFGVQKHVNETINFTEIDWKFIGLTLLILLVSRAMNVFPILSITNCFRKSRNRISLKYMFVIWFAGLRGAIAFALAKSWNYRGKNGSHRNLILSTTLVIILFTTVVIGGLTGLLLSFLGLVDKVSLDDGALSANQEEDSSGQSSENTAQDKNLTKPEAFLKTKINNRSAHFAVKDGFRQHRPDALDVTQLVEGDEKTSEDVPSNTVNRSSYFSSPCMKTPRPQARRQVDIKPEDMSSFERAWNRFDTKYMKSLFGGRDRYLLDKHVPSPQLYIRNAAAERGLIQSRPVSEKRRVFV